ncbi:ferrochelatase [Sulfurimicrobium lacus]|uniref:Ferrochelatase n=1 Tax=Sulfurimicrobium lacus TaxID=2715678 RepID=A0A6F8VH34_9PROT|nr:ferrochelatase [Sulfurimicrobium lacus]BCB28336.1 ferrochelatase [Sulfurimicrobium lacus]
MPFLPEPTYQHGAPAKTGVLLINLGTPDAPTKTALRRYLKEFLSDPRVVEIPRLVWWPILNGIILNTRPAKSAQKYAQIWSAEGSPLAAHTRKQAKMLQGYLGERTRSPLVVEYAMRYGNPSVASALASLKEQGCDRILAFPLYPQYAASSTATALDAVFQTLQQSRNMPELRTVRHYHDDPGYIGALASSVRDHWMQNGRADKLVMSFHGVPKRSLLLGDPYHCECQKTGRLLADALGLAQDQYLITFQSRFGRAEWLQPYTAQTLKDLGKKGCKRVDVICPGFSSDCLETLEEIAMECKADFLNAGGQEYHYIPCLNERDDWMRALSELVLKHLQGWLENAVSPDSVQQSRDRALAMGAKT